MTKKPITIEKQHPGLWHVAQIDGAGRLITRTTVIPDEENEQNNLNGAVGDTDQIAWELGRTIRRLQDRGPQTLSADRYRRMLRDTREWQDQFPNQERPVKNANLPIAIYGDGTIRTPETLIPHPDDWRLCRIGRITRFRSAAHGGYSTFHALRRSGRTGMNQEVPLLEREAPKESEWPMKGIQHQDAWYELVLAWWQSAHERKLLELIDGAWTLPRNHQGPKRPFRVP